MKFPILFASNATDFFSLGLGPMTNTLEATVTEERNGSFYFDSKVIIDDQCYPLLEENRIIRADASPELLDQRFRIKKITDNHDGTAQVYAEHVSYITQELSLKPQVTVSGTGSTAINVWKNAIIDSNPLTVDSNIPTSTMTSWRIDEVENARQALGGVKGSLLDKWGGEYRFDNYHISLLQKRGTTANVLLAYGRNITDFEQERNITDTYNALYPYAIYSDDNQKEHLVTLPTFFVDAENIANFPNRKAFPIDFSDQFKQDEVPTAAKLKSLAQSYIKSNDIGIPKVSIKVSFIDLAKTTDYADIAPLEKLNLCDEVRVIYPKLNVNTTAKVVRVVWNVLAETYDQIEIGEKRVSLSDKLNEQSQSIKEANIQANTAISASNNKNTVFYGLYGTDGLGEPIANKVGDLWFKPDGEETVMLQWDGTLWRRIINTGKLTELDQAFEENNKKIEQAEKELEQTKMDLVKNTKDIEQNKLDIEQNIKDTEVAAKQLAADKLILEQTVADLVVANKNLENNKAYIDSVKAQADTMSTKIDNQQTVIDTSNQLANAAKSASDQAVKDVQIANALANEAKSISASAQSDAAIAKANASTAVSNASTAMTNAKNSLDKANSIDQTVQTEVKRIDGELSSKATKTSLDTLNGTVSNQTTLIAQNQNDIKLKANQSTVDTLNQTISNQGTSIEANAKAISLKASQTDVNAISGRVSSVESSVKVNADSIKSLVSKTDGTNTQLSSLTQDVNGFKQQVVNDYVTINDLQKISADSMIQNGNFTGGSLYWSLGSTSSVKNSNLNGVTNYVQLNGFQTAYYTGNIAFKKNRKYRISFLAYTQKGWTGDNQNAKLRLGDRTDGSYLVDIQVVSDFNNQDKWIPFEKIYTSTKDLQDVELSLKNTTNNNSFIGYANVMIVDVTDIIEVSSNLSQFKQDVEGFQSLVASTYETKDVVSSKVTKVSQDLGTFKVAVSDTYSTKGDLNSTNVKVANLSLSQSKFETTVSETYLPTDIFEKAGNSGNIINNGDFLNKDLYWSLPPNASFGTLSSKGNYLYVSNTSDGAIRSSVYKPRVSFLKNRSYRVVFDINVSSDYNGPGGNTKFRIGDRSSGGNALIYDIAYPSQRNQWVTVTGTIKFNTDYSNCEVSFQYGGTKGSVSVGSVLIYDITDITETNSAVATLTQTVSGFQQTVAQTYETKDGVASKIATVNQTISGIRTTVGETQAALEKKMDNEAYNTQNSNGDNSGKWVRFLYTKVPARYLEVQLSLDILSNGSGDGKLRACRLLVRHKQQNPLGTSNPTLMLEMDNVTNMSNGDIRAVLIYNNETEGSTIAYYIRMDTSYLGYSISPYNRSGGGSVSYISYGDWVSFPSNANAWDVTYGGSYEKATYIEQEVGKLELGVVKKDKVVSSINLNPEGIRLQGKLITLDGTSYIANGVIKDSHIENATIQTASIADAAITNAKIANLAVSTAKIAELAVQNGKIADAAITNAKIADATITTAKIGDLAVTNAKIGDLAVTGAKIANASITEAKIGDASIVNAHIKDATIESAKIKSISAEKITAGTLNAANVNIINLNANNITSGNINGINITGSTVTSQKGSSKIILDGGALSWYTSNGIVGSIYTTEENYENFANWDVYDNGYFSIRGKGTRDGETYMRYGWGELKSIVSGMVSIISKNKYADRSTSLELNNSQVILKAGSGSGSSYRQGQIQVGAYGTSVTGGMTISGGLSVTGSKNAIHQVDGQWYATPAYETAESYLGDIGSATTNNDSMVLIPIDNLFGRIVNTSLEYQVFVSSYGSGHVWVEKRTQNAFVVRSSEPNTKFAWEIKAKRKGYEQERLVKHSLIA